MIQEIKIKDLKILRDTNLQSPTLDSVILSDFVKINRKVRKVLDIGSGNGIISLILSKKMKAKIIGVEIQEELYNLSLMNLKLNNLEVEYILDDVYNYSKNLHQEFDVIVSNPPYFVENNENQLRDNQNLQIARNELSLKIEDIIKISDRVLKNMGHLYLVFRVSRLEEVIKYLQGTKLVIKELQFVYTKKNEDALLVLVDIVKGANIGVVVRSPLNVYDEVIKEKIYK